MRLLFISYLVFFSFAAHAGGVADKCTDAMTELGASNVGEGCACFEAALDEALSVEYQGIDLTDWVGTASDGLKEAAQQCFPDDNTN